MQEERQRAAEDQRAQILKALLAPSARERRKIASVVLRKFEIQMGLC
jgi:hypothetical protein